MRRSVAGRSGNRRAVVSGLKRARRRADGATGSARRTRARPVRTARSPRPRRRAQRARMRVRCQLADRDGAEAQVHGEIRRALDGRVVAGVAIAIDPRPEVGEERRPARHARSPRPGRKIGALEADRLERRRVCASDARRCRAQRRASTGWAARWTGVSARSHAVLYGVNTPNGDRRLRDTRRARRSPDPWWSKRDAVAARAARHRRVSREAGS